MADIKLTLSQDTRLRSNSIEDEAEWVNTQGPIFYGLHREPKTAQRGCWVYFVRAGYLVARAKADDFVEQDEDELYTYKNVEQKKSGWSVKCTKMKVLPEQFCISTNSGFQGFQNVQGEEQAQFEAAFKLANQANP